MTEFSQGLENEVHVWSQVASKLPEAVGAKLLDDVQNDKTKLILENVAAAGIGLVLKRSPVTAATALANVALISLGYDAIKIGTQAWQANTDAERNTVSDAGAQLLASQGATMIESTPGLALGSLGTSALSRGVPSLSPYLESPSIKAAQNIELPLRAKFSAGSAVEPIEVQRLSEPVKYNRSAYMGGQSQGQVYDNANGTVTKVITGTNDSAAKLEHAHNTLYNMGFPVPPVIATGVTAEGREAVIVKKIGDGDNLKYQLRERRFPAEDAPELKKQWWQMADKLNAKGLQVDFRPENLAWVDKKLWLFDPSYLHNGIMDESYLSRYVASWIGPRM